MFNYTISSGDRSLTVHAKDQLDAMIDQQVVDTFGVCRMAKSGIIPKGKKPIFIYKMIDNKKILLNSKWFFDRESPKNEVKVMSFFDIIRDNKKIVYRAGDRLYRVHNNEFETLHKEVWVKSLLVANNRTLFTPRPDLDYDTGLPKVTKKKVIPHKIVMAKHDGSSECPVDESMLVVVRYKHIVAAAYIDKAGHFEWKVVAEYAVIEFLQEVK